MTVWNYGSIVKINNTMVQKEAEKEKAVTLRRKGLSYREILSQVPVAKSTLSLWLGDVGLSKRQKGNLTRKRLEAAMRGGAKRREQRLIATRLCERFAKEELDRIKNRELWLAGIMLYWAEGSKQKITNVSQAVKFSNSDAVMIRLFLRWLKVVARIPPDGIKCELYIHKNGDVIKATRYWNQNLAPLKIDATYFKTNNVSTKRKNIGESYNGLVTVRVRKSTNLNRKISAWISLYLQQENIIGE